MDSRVELLDVTVEAENLIDLKPQLGTRKVARWYLGLDAFKVELTSAVLASMGGATLTSELEQ